MVTETAEANKSAEIAVIENFIIKRKEEGFFFKKKKKVKEKENKDFFFEKKLFLYTDEMDL